MKKILIFIIVFLVGWNSYLTYRIENMKADHSENNTPEVNVIHNDVNGFSTDLTKVIEKVEPSVVRVRGIRGNVTPSEGSGIIWRSSSEEVYILTNASILSRSTSYQIEFDNGAVLEAELIGQDELTDIALLKTVPDFNVETISLGSSSLLKKGEWVIAVGASSPSVMNQGSVSVGIVSSGQTEIGLDQDTDGFAEWQCLFMETDVEVNQATSGGAIVNMNGELVGIISDYGALESFSLAVPSDELILIAESLLNNGTVNRYSLGISVVDISTLTVYQKSYLGISLDTVDGLYISEVEEASLAAKAGIAAGDILVSMKDSSVDTLMQYRQQLYKLVEKETIVLSVLRDGSEIKAELVIE